MKWFVITYEGDGEIVRIFTYDAEPTDSVLKEHANPRFWNLMVIEAKTRKAAREIFHKRINRE